MNMTPWFPPEVRPIRPGVYETNAADIGESYQYWTGTHWGLQGDRKDFWPFITKNAKLKSMYQNVRWRGLAEPPKKAKAK